MRAAGMKRTLIEAVGNGPQIVLGRRRPGRGRRRGCRGRRVPRGPGVRRHRARARRGAGARRVRRARAGAGRRGRARASARGGHHDGAAQQRAGRREDGPAHRRRPRARRARCWLGGAPRRRLPDRPLLRDDRGRRGVARHAPLPRGVVRAGAADHDVPLATTRRSRWPTTRHLGLQAAVFTSSLRRAFRFIHELRAGSIQVNETTGLLGGAPAVRRRGGHQDRLGPDPARGLHRPAHGDDRLPEHARGVTGGSQAAAEACQP